MPTLNGVSVLGRQVLALAIPASTNVFVSSEVSPVVFRKDGYIALELKQNTGNKVWQFSGKSLWYNGVHFGTPGAIAGTSFQIAAFWTRAGVPWQVVY